MNYYQFWNLSSSSLTDTIDDLMDALFLMRICWTNELKIQTFHGLYLTWYGQWGRYIWKTFCKTMVYSYTSLIFIHKNIFVVVISLYLLFIHIKELCSKFEKRQIISKCCLQFINVHYTKRHSCVIIMVNFHFERPKPPKRGPRASQKVPKWNPKRKKIDV